MVSWVDLLPTLLEAAGGKAPGRHRRAARSCPCSAARRPSIATGSSPPTAATGAGTSIPIRSVRTRGWKYIRNLHPEFAFTTHIDLPDDRGRRSYFSSWEAAAKSDPRAAAVVKRYHARPAEELYDLAADPHEQAQPRRRPAPRRAARDDARPSSRRGWSPRATAAPSSPNLASSAIPRASARAPPGNVPATSTAKE